MLAMLEEAKTELATQSKSRVLILYYYFIISKLKFSETNAIIEAALTTELVLVVMESVAHVSMFF